MILAVTGGRAFSDAAMVDRNLRKWIYPSDYHSVVIHGDAPGLDTLAKWWAVHNGVHYAAVPALWDAWGKAAGPYRNEAMLSGLRPELLLAFPGGRGTASAVHIAQQLDISVRFAE